MPQSAVVRIYATTQDPDYDCPWQARTPTHSTGSGVIIDQSLVLTGAHVVANATFVQVQKISDPNKSVAEVAAICHDCDLALLRVRHPSFMEGVQAAPLGELPDLRDRVSVIGFPLGGEEVSITEGVVSRIEVQRYSHSQRHLLAVTVDAAINQGNSGGPVFKDGDVVGIAFQKLAGVDNIGEMVPPPVIRQFLSNSETQVTSHVPGLGVTVQCLENPRLREHLALPEDRTGVVVISVEADNSASAVLEVGDALLAVDGTPIANNGTVRYRGRHRTRYDAFLGERSVGDTVKFDVLRNGKTTEISLDLKPLSLLVPRSRYDVQPPYFIFGGLVFQVLSRDYLTTWEGWWDKAPKEFLHAYYTGSRTDKRRQVVILTQVLADEVNVGYEDLYSESVATVDGNAPLDLADFVSIVDANKGTVTIRTSTDSLVVLDAEEARSANAAIMERYHIGRDRSEDLDAKWGK